MNNTLIGKTILAMKIAQDKKALLFKTDGGEVIAKTDGEAGSISWIEHIELPALGFPATVTSVDDTYFQEEDGGELKIYGCKVVTNMGIIMLDYRNESNGYYGGNLCWPRDDFDGGTRCQNESDLVWMDIVD